MYYFIVNPKSGSGRGRIVWNTIEKELKQQKIPCQAFLLTKPGEAKALASGLSGRQQPAVVVVVGGDGTINEVLNGLSSLEGITFACIPTGSGNDFVRGLGLTRGPLAALESILHPKRIRKINIGSVNDGQYSFAVSAGFGYDAAVCHSVDRSRLKKALNLFHLGRLAYLLTALRLLLTMKRQTLQITVDGGDTLTFRKTYFAAAMNLRYEGGGFMFAPDALPGDDCLDLIVASEISRLRVLYLLPLALLGKHVGHRGVTLIRCKKAALHCAEPLSLHTDGEAPGFESDVTFSLRAEKLSVILE